MKEKKQFGMVFKTIAFILMLLGMVSVPVGAVGTFYLVQEGFYLADADSLKDKYLEEYMSNFGKMILYTYYIDGEAAANQQVRDTSVKYRVFVKGGSSYGNYPAANEIEWSKVFNYTRMTAGNYKFTSIDNYYIEMIVPIEKERPDYVARVCFLANNSDTLKVLSPGMVIGGCILSVGSFVYLMCGAGWNARKKKQTGGVLGFLPLEVLIVLAVFAGIWIWRFLFRGFVTYGAMIQSAAGLLLMSLVLAVVLISVSARMKEGMFWRYSILGRLWKRREKPFGLISDTIRGIPSIWKYALVAGGIILLEFLTLVFTYHHLVSMIDRKLMLGVIVLWVLESVFLLVAVFYVLLRLLELKRAGKELAEGNSNYKVDTSLMFGEIKKHGEYLNNISDGVTIAVNERMKSEHLKTELITNVSHDIKTPLTSIINYSDLIRKEESDNEKIKEYSEVLYRQSGRLKKLIEDLVEASKASTGNVEVNMETCDVGVLLTQATAEFEQRMYDKDLDLISKQPETPVQILADPKLLWRVFDNLMTNICKYSQSGTRVYLTVEKNDKKAIISFKNISEYPLDISADELMERFVRGDRSRHTEGNGLGLSIARSLTELQDGNMDLSIDGDLFKVLVTFPIVE